MIVAILVYVALSLVFAGAVVTYEIWHRPIMLDRGDGRGTFPSPKMRGAELMLLGVFVVIAWPIVGLFAIVDALGART